MTTATAAPKDNDKDMAQAGDAIVTERGRRFEEDTDASVRTGTGHGGHLDAGAGERLGSGGGDSEDRDSDRGSARGHDWTETTETGEDDRPEEDAEARRLRLSNTHHGHVLTALRRLHTASEDGGTVSRDDLAEVMEMMEAAHSQPVPQPDSGSNVHGTTGPGAPPDIHHTPFSRTERFRQPGQ